MPNPLFQKFLEIKKLKGMYIGVYYVSFDMIHTSSPLCRFCNRGILNFLSKSEFDIIYKIHKN